MNVCVVKNHELTLTETFIWTHVRGLNADVIHGQPPRLMGDPDRLAPAPLRLAEKVLHKLKGSQVARPDYASLLSTARADVVLAEYGTTGAAVWRACRMRGVPLVVHFHGYDASRKDVLRDHADEYRSMFDYSSAIIAVSRAMRERLIEIGAPQHKVVLNPCSVDVNDFVAGDPSEAPPTFLAVGRLVGKKAPHLLLLAFAEAHRHLPEARLRIIGDGSMRSVLEDMIAGLDLEGSVDLLGAQPHEMVREEMQRARAFVQHSVVARDGDSEGTPVSVLEAAASGLPVVSTDHAGISDAVDDGITGYTVPERDVAGMALRMVEIARDPDLTDRLGRAGRERVQRLYSRDLRNERLREIVLRACDGRPPGHGLLQDPIDETRVPTL